ncbi:TPA: hypothetical protein N0F65_013046 [Lagenidium giganteum]|uniref:Uncharacterized protein n=1 Tax=Lagenidium giganteum TaxID=4803 RepID=A0AAV2YN15_9STRA|nr:TPA: hypothetical protein N0F65_013046 [Lagenidium giganteum]
MPASHADSDGNDNDVLHSSASDDSDAGGGSVASSFDSEVYGDVARAGFTRMYVFMHSKLAPLDKHLDYEDEAAHQSYMKWREDHRRADDKGCGASDGNEEEDSDGDRLARYQLLYGSGKHYFHGDVCLPDSLLASLGEDMDDDDDLGMDGKNTASSAASTIGVDDLPLLLPFFLEQHDELMAVDDVLHFRHELRDVVYQMEEVGEFVVEELVKEKNVARIEQGAKELQWIAADSNPTFFELQTHPATNESMDTAGVLVVVMKIVVRGVLLDVVYAHNSYFVTLRDNVNEIALEDTFIPNGENIRQCQAPLSSCDGEEACSYVLFHCTVSRSGPCFVVRRFKDEDLKQLLLWCSLPTVDGDLQIQGSSCLTNVLRQPTIPRALPRRAKAASILAANDTHLYCVFGQRQPGKKARKKNTSLNDDTSQQLMHVFFQFNEFVYAGNLDVHRLDGLDDLAKLTTKVFPQLREHAHELQFQCEDVDLPTANSDDAAARFTAASAFFRRIAASLLDLLVESQTWVEEFTREVDTIASTSGASDAPWLGEHLKAWIEGNDGLEHFYELELASVPPEFQSQSEILELLVWSGIVHRVLMVVVYRRGSFYLMLRDADQLGIVPIQDGLELFGHVPVRLGSKGRGYLVRQLPAVAKDSSQTWLANAKLLLWQTAESIDREDIAEAEAKARTPRQAAGSQKACGDWFVPEDADNKCTTKRAADEKGIRPAEHVSDKPHSDVPTATSSAPKPTAKAGRPHHVAPLGSLPKRSAVMPAPWDLRTGKPV